MRLDQMINLPGIESSKSSLNSIDIVNSWFIMIGFDSLIIVLNLDCDNLMAGMMSAPIVFFCLFTE